MYHFYGIRIDFRNLATWKRSFMYNPSMIMRVMWVHRFCIRS